MASVAEPIRIPDSGEDLRILLLIRHFELAVLDLFGNGLIGGTTHTSLGQEYVAVALRTLLRDEDVVLSNHRSHAHYLARYPDPEPLLAEILGREGALCRGVGGSQHLYRPGFFSTGVQGETLPLAVGIGLHLKRTTSDAVTVVYVGDGSWGEGAVYEALNMAALWTVPVIVVVENNGIAQSTPARLHMAGDVAARAAAFGISCTTVTALDLDALRAQAAPVFDAVRRHRRPRVLEVRTVRVGPHSKGDDSRSPEELDQARDSDWYSVFASQDDERFRAADAGQRSIIKDLVLHVSARPASVWRAPAGAGAVR